MPSPFNGNFLVCRSATEVSGTPRTLKAIIEDKLDITLPGDLAVSIFVQNQSGGTMKLHHLSTGATHYWELAAGVSRQLTVGDYRLPLSQVYLTVATTNDPLSIEVVFE